MKILKEYYNEICPDIAIKIAKYVTISFVLSAIGLGLYELSYVILVFFFEIIVITVFALSMHTIGIIKKKKLAKWGMAINLVLITAMIHDSLVFDGDIQSFYSLVPASYVFFFVAITLSTFKVYQKAFDKVDEQKKELGKRIIEVENLNERIEKTIEIKDEFLKRTSHEMKAPLNGIIGMTEMMIEGEAGLMSQAAMNQIAIIGYSSRRLNNMISNVVDASKIALEEIEVEIRPVNVKGVLDVVQKLTEKDLKKSSMSLEIEVDESLSVLGDEEKLNQVFGNLVNNAIQHSGASRIYISTGIVGDEYVEIFIEDNGKGINDKIRDKLFEKKEIYDIKDDNNVGGLGLYISKELCNIQKGFLFIKDSERFGGARFIVSLRRSKTTARKGIAEYLSRDQQLLISNEDEENGNDLAKKKSLIWIIDDDPSNLEILKEVLYFYNLECFSDPEKALEEIKYKKPNLILLDIMMPKISGYEVCREIRKLYNYSEVPIIFLTALSSTDEVLEGFNVGGNDYMIKPITKSIVRARVKTQLALSMLHKRLVTLRGYSNRISEFRSMRDMLNAIYDLLSEEESVENIVFYEGGNITRAAKKDENIISLETLDLYIDEHANEVESIQIEGKNYVIIDLKTIGDIVIIVEYSSEPEAIDKEYLKNAVYQIKATKNNITKLISRSKEIGEISKIMSKKNYIRHIEATGNYVNVIFGKGRSKQRKIETIKTTMNTIRLYLGEDELIRIHRKYMINRKYIRMVWQQAWNLEVDVDGDILTVGKTYVRKIREIAQEDDIKIVKVNLND